MESPKARHRGAQPPLSARKGGAGSVYAPLGVRLYRRMWTAGFLSNLGLMIMGVGAAWQMTELSGSAARIALVQSALMLPVMLFALVAGAIADMFDRRRVALLATAISFLGSLSLTLLSVAGLLSPWILLACCALVGSGSALLWPSWSAAVREQVPAAMLPRAIALNAISYNIARIAGPAVGGAIVAAVGASGTFSVNCLLYLPLFVALLLWRRAPLPQAPTRERLHHAISSGLRYMLAAPPVRNALARTFAVTFSGAALFALMPLVARDLLRSEAATYGAILGAFGAGAVIGALFVIPIRDYLGTRGTLASGALFIAAGSVGAAASTHIAPTMIALFLAGCGWMVSLTLLNIAIQLQAPAALGGRLLAAYQTSIGGGIAIGSWLWGLLAAVQGVAVALVVASFVTGLTILLGRLLPLGAADGA